MSAETTNSNGTEKNAGAKRTANTKASSGKFILNDRYEIFLSRPVSEFEHIYADTYEAIAKDGGQSYLAYVIKDRYPARLDVADYLIKQDIPRLLSIKDYGVTTASDGSQRLVVLTDKPSITTPIMSRHQSKRAPLQEDVIRKNILRPVVQALKNLHDADIFHGNIRVDNVFWNNVENAEALLGECVTSLPGSIQPASYETIERAMADPCGRGVGALVEDVYALGILVAILFRGTDPTAGKSTKAMIEDKINRGSFTVMTEGLQLSSNLMEFLRATLHDDPRARWTMDQVWMWVIGNHVTSKQIVSHKKVGRVLEFNGTKYMNLRLIARDLQDNPVEALELIESGNLIKWLERCLLDKVVIDTVQAAINRANYNNKGTGYEDRLLCMVSMSLDPRAPIRYKGLSVMPAGIGGMLVDAIIREQPLQVFAECIREKLAWLWLGYKENEAMDANDLSKRFDNVSKIILRRGIDYGLERCLYELLMDVPCLSMTLSSYYVLTCAQLLQALDKVGEDKARPQQPLDRHIASFISTHDQKDNSLYLILAEGTDPLKRPLALVTLFQSMQKRHQVPPLSGLADWLSKDIEQIAQRYHNRRYRKNVVKNVESDIKGGNLTRLLTLVDSPQEIGRDRSEFEQARIFYRRLEKEHDYLESNLKRNDVFGRATGRQIAAVISGVMGGLFMAATLLMKLTNSDAGM
ncbi:MAG TPA: hypothetical protein VGF14_07495 [Alphaproteobacteria bacterium]